MEEREPEIWADVIGYEGLYQVSSWGRVKSLPKEWIVGNGTIKKHDGKILTNNLNSSGYLNVSLYKNKKLNTSKVHRLVAEAFISNPNNYPLVMHMDDDPSNNYYKNLQFGTVLMNNQDRENKGRGNHAKGEKHYLSKLTKEQVNEIRSKYTGKYGEQIKLAKEYGVTKYNINDIINKKSWKHI